MRSPTELERMGMFGIGWLVGRALVWVAERRRTGVESPARYDGYLRLDGWN